MKLTVRVLENIKPMPLSFPISQQDSDKLPIGVSTLEELARSSGRAILGISISSSTNSATTCRLDCAPIHTLSLSQHDLVLAVLLSHDQRRNCWKMFRVIGVKVAGDAEVQKDVSRGRLVSGKLPVDVVSAIGVQEGLRLGKIGGGEHRGDGESDERGEGRKEKLLGNRGFVRS